MSAKIKKIFARELENLDAAGLLRTDTPVTHTDDMKVNFKRKSGDLNFMTTDLLGWNASHALYDTAADALHQYGTGTTAPRTTLGTLEVVKNLESKLASFIGVDDCIVFPTNYMANLSLFEPLTDNTDTIFIDEMSNPALYDGLRLSKANIISYKHQDYDDLEYHLKCAQNSRFRIIVTDGVFTTDGNNAELQRLYKLKKTYDAILVVDDSLGIGVLGQNGRGSCNQLNLEYNPEIITGTFTLALGNVGGGFIAGDKDLLNWIRHTSRSYLVSEPLSPVNAAVVIQAIELLEKETFNPITDAGDPDLDDDASPLKKLYSNATYLKNEMQENNWLIKRNKYPFVSVNVGSTMNAQRIVEILFKKKILASAMCYPNTPEGAALLRVNLSAAHTKKQIDKFIKALAEAFKEVNK